MIRAVISIGTNSTRALVADVSAGSGRPLLQRSIGTRIGEGLKESGRLGAEPMKRTLDAIEQHAAAIRQFTGEVFVIATSAIRRADNAREFGRRVREIVHADLQIVSGEDEARYSFEGALSGLDASPHERFGVADPGGGSTEYAIGSKGKAPERAVSCETGAVRLTEAVPVLAGDRGEIDDDAVERARAIVLEATDPISQFERADRLVFVGGTASSTVSLLQGTREPFAYGEFSLEEVERVIAQLRALDLPARKLLPAMNPQRADILLGGLIVIAIVFERTGHNRAVVSTNDLLMGYLISRP
ncbi:MAG TPA: hypothetical protein VGZ02_12975 [Candidatus Baltobacteraceae bacterium]|nr:hypothetical protein [Candidatus Baltobacteraceae bacterium]